MKNIRYIIVALSVLLCSQAGMAQTALSSYFLDGMLYNSKINPAMKAERGYFSLLVGNTSLGAKGNVGLSNFLYPREGDKLATFMSGSVSADEFLSNLPDYARMGVNLDETLLAAGFRLFGGYASLGLSLHSSTMLSIPKDFFAFAKDPKTSPRLQYEYLYGDSVLPLKYLLSRDSWEAVGEKIKYNMRDKFSKKGEYRVDYNLMFGHPPRSERYNKKALHKFVKKNNVLPAPIRENAYHNLENFLFANIRKHPEIKFDLFFPPYNIFFWCTLEKAGYVNGYLELRDYIIREAVKYPNVRLHDFQPDSTIVCNQDIYKDVTHYNVETGRLILQSMASGKHQIDVAAGVKNSQSIRQQIKQHMPEFLKLSPL